jgi:DNA/RNA endonuclease YhcR with UshA esterase domain
MVEFSNGDGTQYARLEDGLTTPDYQTNRYVVISKRLDELTYSTIFDWKEVSVIRVYVSAIDDVATTTKQANGTTATITTAAHLIPVNSTITNASGVGGVVTYTAVNTFAPGDVVTITGVSPSVYNLSNVRITESDATSFKVSSGVSGSYTSGGTAIIQNAIVTVSGVNGADTGFDGTFTLTSVPSSTQIVYARVGTVVGSTGVVGSVDIYRSNYYIALDAIRFDNISTINPLYGMTGYSIIQNVDAETIIKGANTSNYIEYRFILDVT